MVDVSEAELEIRATSGYFNSLLELIPTKYYLKSDDEVLGNLKQPKKKQKNANKKLLVKKAKLFKLDPSAHKTSSELQLEIEHKENELLKDDCFNDTQMKSVNVSCITSKPLEELRAKLHAKVALLSSNRKVVGDKSKKRRLESKEQENVVKKRKKDHENIKRVNEVEGKLSNGLKQGNSVESKVMFSKFDFATQVNDVRKRKKQKTKKQLLVIAEKTRDKLIELESANTGKAQELKKEIAWKNALKKAEGGKVKDDPKLLKKSLKKKDKQKQKSKLKWNERIKTVEIQKLEKQKLRKQHIQERKESKTGKNKKSKTKTKKPGF